MRRHEALRTVFGLQEGQPVQQILPAAFHLPLIDLSMLESQDAEVERLLAEEIHHAFDLAQGPLFRATLLCLQPQQEHVLLLRVSYLLQQAPQRQLPEFSRNWKGKWEGVECAFRFRMGL